MSFELQSWQPNTQGSLRHGSIRDAGGANGRRGSPGCGQSFQTPIQIWQRAVVMRRICGRKKASQQEDAKNGKSGFHNIKAELWNWI